PARVEDFAGAYRKGAYLGTISVLGALGATVIQLIIGPLSDHCRAKWGRRRPFLLIGTLGGIAAMVGFAIAQSFVGLVVSFFLIQLFINIANGPYQAFIPDHVPSHNQGRASAFMGLMQLLGEAGGPVIAGMVLGNAAKVHGSALVVEAAKVAAIQRLLFADAVLLVVFMLASVVLVPDEPSTSTGSAWAAVRSLADLKIRENPSFYWLLLSRMVFNLGFYIALAFLAYYVQDSLGFGKKDYYKPLLLIQLIAIASALVGTFPAGYLADRMSKKSLVYVSGVFTFASTVAFALAGHIGFAYAMTVFFGLGYGIFRAVDWAFACNLLPKGGAAKYMAIWSLSATLPQVLAPAFGPVADHINRAMGLGAGWRAAMFASAIAGLAGILLISRVTEPRQREATPQAPDQEPAVPPIEGVVLERE
ncbi:MAG TPA: MFS transporter, partial [Capsulimonadaceae bacterium]|nr:MFS transporter [Capsulimonadaceae bacterium]